MFEPEYRIGLRVLRETIGTWSTLKVVILAIFKSVRIRYHAEKDADEPERTKAQLKNHFKLLAQLYKELQRRYGRPRTHEIMRDVLMRGGKAFFRGFTPLEENQDLVSFAKVYKAFERNNIVFDVLEESKERFEIVVKRCLVYEAFHELDIADATQWMCDIAFEYFSGYHPNMTYIKDRMIARGDATCHEVFIWQ
jgi:predicted ArsR family transcriptional regulator